MLLGKRPGPPIRRTTSMAGITVDLTTTEASQPSDYPTVGPMAETITAVHPNPTVKNNMMKPRTTTVEYEDEQSRNYRKRTILDIDQNNNDFLRTCSLCSRHLGHGRDIYMYRGDTAFCSLECRERQIKRDERKEKNGVVSKKIFDHA